LALALNNERISLDAMALTDHNVHYDTIKVNCSLKAPVVDISPTGLAGCLSGHRRRAEHR
jgi:hypothetical protein